MNNETEIKMIGVCEYVEGYGVWLDFDSVTGRPIARAYNEAGCNCTEVDLLDLIAWVKSNRPELLLVGV